METQNTSNELELIRQQMELLKEKLATQEIVNEKLIISSMKKKMSWIKKYIIFEVGLLPIIAIMWLGIKMIAGLSWYNYAFMIIMCCIDVYIDYFVNLRGMRDSDFQKCNMIETTKKLTNMKKQRSLQMLIQIPLLIIWLLWSGYEAVHSLDMPIGDFQRGFTQGGLVGGSIGAVIGILFAYKIYKKMQKTNDEVISQMNDFVIEEDDRQEDN